MAPTGHILVHPWSWEKSKFAESTGLISHQAFPLGPIQGQDPYGYGFKTGSQKSCPWPESLTHTDGYGHASQKIWILHVQNISKLMLVPLWLQTQPCWVFQDFYCDFSRFCEGFFSPLIWSLTPRSRPDDRAIFIHPWLHVAHLVAKGILLLKVGRPSKSSQKKRSFKDPQAAWCSEKDT